MARGPVSTEWSGILGTVGNKETYSVDILLATFFAKNDRPQNGRLRDGAAILLNYKSFLA
jgi:hypothetical protein